MNKQQLTQHIPALADVINSADHLDIKTFKGQATLRGFLYNMLSYMPAWLKGLYGIRAGFVRLLGMKQSDIPTDFGMTQETFPFESGVLAGFFRVVSAEEEQFWSGVAQDKHLDAYLAVIVDDTASAGRQFHVATVVQYKHWTGPVYFNVIRPFHHIVLRAMGNAALKRQPQVAAAQGAKS